MAELDPLDARLEHAVHAFADRAQTSVDAVAVAAQAIGHRRTGPSAVLGRAVPVPVVLLVVPLVLVGLLGWSLAGGGPFPVRVWLGPVATPTAAPTPSPTPTPTVLALAPAHVTGTATSTQLSPKATLPAEGMLPPMTGAVLELVIEMDDPRVTGTGTLRARVDQGSGVSLGFVSGSLRLDTMAGAWEGPCTGASWNGLTPFYDGVAGANLSCWLDGVGAYDGLTFYLNYRFAGWEAPDELEGTVFPAEPPSP